jgi:hypothetical protein
VLHYNYSQGVKSVKGTGDQGYCELIVVSRIDIPNRCYGGHTGAFLRDRGSVDDW